MVPMLRVKTLLNCWMTYETFPAADFLSDFVTLRTIVQPLQLLVRTRKLPRRKLTGSSIHQENLEQCKQDKGTRSRIDNHT